MRYRVADHRVSFHAACITLSCTPVQAPPCATGGSHPDRDGFVSVRCTGMAGTGAGPAAAAALGGPAPGRRGRSGTWPRPRGAIADPRSPRSLSRYSTACARCSRSRRGEAACTPYRIWFARHGAWGERTVQQGVHIATPLRGVFGQSSSGSDRASGMLALRSSCRHGVPRPAGAV